MFKSSDLKWLKSVTRDKGKEWAYMEFGLGDDFLLHFSKSQKWYPTNYLNAKPGDLLVLFQTLSKTKTFAGGTFVTHLVTPLNNSINKVDYNPNHPYVRLMGIVGVAKEKKALDLTWSLFKANRGQICYIDNVISSRGEKSIEEKQNFLFNLFELGSDLITQIDEQLIDVDDDKGLEEGAERTMYKLHKFRERKPEIIALAKDLAQKEDRLFCEVCTFDFDLKYPELGRGFIECHHRIPISKGGIRKTKVSDLALVCSNCHRMLHRKYNNDRYLLVEELKELIERK